MNQQINLYQKDNYRNTELFRAHSLLYGGGAALFLPLLLSVFVAFHLHSEGKHAQILEHTGVLATQQLNDLRTHLTQSQDKSTLKDKLRELEKLVSYRQQIEKMIQSDMLEGQKGYAKYFIALAKQHVRGLWLTRIRIGGAGKNMELRGAARDPALIPQFLQRLSRTQVFSGTDFQVFDLHRPANDKQTAYLPYVEFVITTQQEIAQ